MFINGLQAYCAPYIGLLLMFFLLHNDALLEKKVKNKFYLELLLLAVILTSTWADQCLSEIPHGTAYLFRRFTTMLEFSLSPLALIGMLSIYLKGSWLCLRYILPWLIDTAVCVASLFVNLIFYITPENVYMRGPLFFVPFLTAIYYMIVFVSLSSKQDRPNRQMETLFLAIVMALISGVMIAQITFRLHFMMWATIVFAVLSYYLLLNTQSILFDTLTGTKSRAAYVKHAEKMIGKCACTIAMPDINRLKEINDSYGHRAGDEALRTFSLRMLGNLKKKAQLYRYGGDEFVILWRGEHASELTGLLEAARSSCGEIQGIPITYSYGVQTYRTQESYDAAFRAADSAMYRDKLKSRCE